MAAENLDNFWDSDEEFLKEDQVVEPVVEEEEEESVEDGDEVVEDQKSNSIKEFISGLSAAGLLPETDEEITMEEAVESIILNAEEYIEQGITSALESWKDEIGERGVEFAKFTRAGGDPDEFFKAYAQDHLQFDVSSDRGQEAFLQWYYKKHEEMDDDDIEDRLLSLRDREKTADTAKRLFSKLKDKRDKEAQSVVKARLDQAEKQKVEFQKEKEKLVKGLQKVEGFGELKISKLEKPILINMITRASETFDGQRVTGLTKALNAAYDRPEVLMVLAKWAKTDFDPSFFSKESSAKQTKRELNPKPKKKNILDYFD